MSCPFHQDMKMTLGYGLPLVLGYENYLGYRLPFLLGYENYIRIRVAICLKIRKRFQDTSCPFSYIPLHEEDREIIE